MLPVVDDSPAELDDLRSQLAATEEELDTRVAQEASGWGLPLAGIQQHVVGTGRIAAVYVLLNAGALGLGIAFTVLSRSLESLGVALVVGAVFGFGAFIAQFWAVAAQREFAVRDEVFGSLEDLKGLNEKRLALAERIELLAEEQKADSEVSPESPAARS